MKPSQACIDLIESFEGYATALPNGDCLAYPDPTSVNGDPYTIGKGTTFYRGPGIAKYGRNKVMKGDTLTREQAEQEFQLAINYFSKVINGATNKLNQQQFDAAVSFAYNTGPNTRQITRLQSGAVKEFRRMMPQYIKGVSGKNEPGLVRRRKAETDLWDSGSQEKEPPLANWINLVRHGSKAEPDLRAYLMDNDTAVSLKRFTTTQDLINILAAHRNAGITIGEYGWHKEPVETGTPPAKNGVATLKRTGKKRGNGLEILALEFNGELFECVSGQPYAQSFRRPEHPRSLPGCMEPIPFGDYRIGDIEWAGGKDNYDASWGPGLGPCWIALKATFSDDRSAFGIHLDSNAGTSPGSAGCVVIPNISELKRLVAALRKHDPKILKVQWN